MTSTSSHDRCAGCGLILGPHRRIIGDLVYHTDCGPHIRKQKEEPTLRDHIAMAALTGILAYGSRTADADTDAKWSYVYADAMLEARKAKP